MSSSELCSQIPETEADYEAGNLEGHGNDYQRQMAWMLLQRAMFSESDFKLAFEMTKAGKFDDIGLFLDNVWFLIQTKHSQSWKSGQEKTLTKEILFDRLDNNKNSSFSILKYLKGYQEMKKEWKHGDIEKIIIFTNRDLEHVDSYNKVELNKLLTFSKGCHIDLSNHVDEIMNILKDEAFKRDYKIIFEAFRNLLDGNGEINKVLEVYNTYLRQIFVIRDHDVIFSDKNQLVNPDVKKLFQDLQKNFGENNKLKNASVLKSKMAFFWSHTEEKIKTDIDEATVKEFLSKLVLSVGQPNVTELRQTIIDESRYWMRTWIRPDDFGRLDESFFEQPLNIIKKEFDEYEKSLQQVNIEGKLKTKRSFLQKKEGHDILTIIKSKLKSDIEIGSKRSCASLEATAYYYINRQIHYYEQVYQRNNPLAQCEIILDNEFVKQMFKAYEHQDSFILTAAPGMGKSTLWQYLAFEAQKVHLDKGVFLIYLNNIEGNIPNVDKLEDILTKNIFKSDLSKHNVEMMVNETNTQIILFLDAFDELTESNQYQTIQLVQVLLRRKNIKVIISGRRHVQQMLEKHLCLISLELPAFSIEEQKMFFEKYWKKSYYDLCKLNKFSEKILEKFHGELISKEHDFTGVPLMIRMLAEIYSGPFEQYMKSNVDIKNIIPNEKFSVTGLYDQFVKKCIKITMNKRYNVENNTEPDSFFDPVLESVEYDYQVLAVDTLLKCSIFMANKSFHERLISFKRRISSQQSLVVEMVANQPRFTHLSFGEYLAAKFIFNLGGRLSKCIFAKHICSNLDTEENIRNIFLTMVNAEIPVVHENRSKLLLNLSKPTKNRLKLFQDFGRDALFWLCKRDYVNLVKYFHEFFKYEAIRNLQRKSMLEIAIENDAQNTINYLIEKKACLHPLHNAAASDRFDLVEKFIADGIHVDSRDGGGSTPLYYAKCAKIYQYLIAKGANLQIKNNIKSTVLHSFVFDGDVKFVSEIFDLRDINGFNLSECINCQNTKGAAPIHIAASFGNIEMVELLVKKGALADRESTQGTPLKLAVKKFHKDVVRFLLSDCMAGKVKKDDFFKSGMAELVNTSSRPTHPENDLQKVLERPLDPRDKEKNANIIETCLLFSLDVNNKDLNGNTALHKMAKSDCIKAVELLLNEQADVNVQNYNGETPLHLAARSDGVEIIKMIFAQGCDLSLTDNDGNTVLHVAAVQSSKCLKMIVEKFLSVPLSLDTKNNSEIPALYIASEKGNKENVRILLEAGADVNLIFNNTEFPWHKLNSVKILQMLLEKADKTALQCKNLIHVAARLGCEKSAQILIEANVAIDSRDDFNRTALHLAAEHGRENVLKLLIKNWPDVNCFDKDGRTPLLLSRKREIYELLVSAEAKVIVSDWHENSALHIAAENDCIEMVKYLIDANLATIDCRNKVGKTALHLAAENDHLEVLEILVQSRAILDIEDHAAKTPLFYAMTKYYSRIVRHLVQNSARVDLENFEGMLHEAAASEHKEKMEVLLELGVHIDAVDEQGRTPLHIAALKNREDNVKLLIEAGADADVLDHKGNSALHYAVQDSCGQSLVAYLTDMSSTLNVKNLIGETPLLFSCNAILNTIKHATEALIAKNACIYMANNDGNTPLHLAILRSNTFDIPLLIDISLELNRQNNNGESALHVAVSTESFRTVERLVEKGADLFLQTKKKQTALDLAKLSKSPKFYKYLKNAMELQTSKTPQQVPEGNESWMSRIYGMFN